MITERDLVRKILSKSRNPVKTKVKEIMSNPLVTVTPNTTLEEGLGKLDFNNIRRLVVLDNERIAGLVTQTDIMKEMDRVQQQSRRFVFLQNLQTWIIIAFFIVVAFLLIFKLA
jgi:signal-transduction protein with cAMP-binding, CBS, and nucleotidyltransferase domain